MNVASFSHALLEEYDFHEVVVIPMLKWFYPCSAAAYLLRSCLSKYLPLLKLQKCESSAYMFMISASSSLHLKTPLHFPQEKDADD